MILQMKALHCNEHLRMDLALQRWLRCQPSLQVVTDCEACTSSEDQTNKVGAQKPNLAEQQSESIGFSFIERHIEGNSSTTFFFTVCRDGYCKFGVLFCIWWSPSKLGLRIIQNGTEDYNPRPMMTMNEVALKVLPFGIPTSRGRSRDRIALKIPKYHCSVSSFDSVCELIFAISKSP